MWRPDGLAADPKGGVDERRTSREAFPFSTRGNRQEGLELSSTAPVADDIESLLWLDGILFRVKHPRPQVTDLLPTEELQVGRGMKGKTK